MKVHGTPIRGVFVIEGSPRADSRGTFLRLFCADELRDVVGERKVVQINHSHTREAGTVRGLHFQRAPFAEMKLVRCLKGSVWDVAVDLRRGSETFLQWHSEELTGANGKMMVVPEGCAHGFQTLQPDSELLYLHTEFYHPEAEGGVAPGEPRVGIRWPLDITSVSDRDSAHPPLGPAFDGISV